MRGGITVRWRNGLSLLLLLGLALLLTLLALLLRGQRSLDGAGIGTLVAGRHAVLVDLYDRFPHKYWKAAVSVVPNLMLNQTARSTATRTSPLCGSAGEGTCSVAVPMASRGRAATSVGRRAQRVVKQAGLPGVTKRAQRQFLQLLLMLFFKRHDVASSAPFTVCFATFAGPSPPSFTACLVRAKRPVTMPMTSSAAVRNESEVSQNFVALKVRFRRRITFFQNIRTATGGHMVHPPLRARHRPRRQPRGDRHRRANCQRHNDEQQANRRH